ncbi:MAG: hypothetical protein ABL921_05860, partial [Pirellula sp.]
SISKINRTGLKTFGTWLKTPRVAEQLGYQRKRPTTPEGIMKKDDLGLSYSARKALTVHLGENAGNEIATLIQRMAAQIEELKRNKVSVTQVIPSVSRIDPLTQALESESF